MACATCESAVIGILDIKDYFALPERSAEKALAECVRPAYFVPDSIKADVLFERMRRLKKRLAVVLDEYGGVTGIVTLNDLMELLVGDLEGGDVKPEHNTARENTGKDAEQGLN